MENNSAAAPLTLEEEVQRIFRKFDSNGDGRISLSELGAILNGLGSASSPDEVARIMSELDTDGDGFIDMKEFQAFHCGDGGANNKALKEAFDLFDKDKNGKISAKELHAMLRSLGEKCTIKDCLGMIKSVDVDGDCCVNFEEFKKMMSRGA